MLYEDRKASLLDKVSALENAERKGLQKGLQQGLEKGKKETAKNLLDKGLDIEFVSEVTGLRINEIKMLQIQIFEDNQLLIKSKANYLLFILAKGNTGIEKACNIKGL